MIGKRRIERKTEAELTKIYKDGRIPTPGEIAAKLQDLKEQNLEAPEFTPPDYKRLERFNISTFNKATDAIVDDMDLLYDENIGITAELLKQLSFHDAATKSQLRALNTTTDQLNDLVMTQNAAAGVLMSVYDDFDDLTKVDTEKTTATVDINLGVATLETSKAASCRLNIDKLANLTSLRVTVLDQENVTFYGHEAIAGIAPGTIADNTLTAWGYRVRAVSEGPPIVIEIQIDLVDEGMEEVRFARLDIEPYTWGNMDVTVLFTRDFKNWLALPGYEGALGTDGSDIISFRFPTIRARAIKLIMSKQQPNGTSTIGPETEVPYYHYGIRNIAFYKMGYSASSVLCSKYLRPAVEGDYTIDKVSMAHRARVPEHTNMKFEIGIPGGSGEQTWAEIAPLGTEKQGVPHVLDLSSAVLSSGASNTFILDGELTGDSVRTVDGMPFYKLAGDVLTGERGNLVPGAARLWHGVNAWKRADGNDIIHPPVDISGCQLRFSSSCTWQMLYVPVTDEHAGVMTGEHLYESIMNGGVRPFAGFATDTRLELDHRVLLFGSNQVPVVPSDILTGEAPLGGTVFSPDMLVAPDIAYSVEKVLHVTSDSMDSTPLTLNTGAGVVIHTLRPGSVTTLLGLPKSLGHIKQGRVYLDYMTTSGKAITGYFNIKFLKELTSPDTGDDYIEGGVPDAITYFSLKPSKGSAGNIRPPKPRNDNPDLSGRVKWAVTQIDLTSLVTKVEGSSVWVSKDYWELAESSKVLVTYRRMLDYGEDVIHTNTVTARTVGSARTVVSHRRRGSDHKNTEVTAPAADYKIGTDIRVTEQGLVYAVNRDLIASDVPVKLSVDFSYTPAPADIMVFSTYLMLEKSVQKLQVCSHLRGPLLLDPSSGERFLLRTGGRVVDLTLNEDPVDIPAGLVQVVVQSTDLFDADGRTDRSSAIFRVLNAVDYRGNAIFAWGNQYWARQLAVLDPMQQVSYFNLTRNVYRAERGFFAVKDGDIWLNFDPYREYATEGVLCTVTGEPTGIYGYNAGRPIGEIGGLAGMPAAYLPQFELEYKYRSSEVPAVSGVYLRTTLISDVASAGDITPEFDSYSIRFT